MFSLTPVKLLCLTLTFLTTLEVASAGNRGSLLPSDRKFLLNALADRQFEMMPHKRSANQDESVVPAAEDSDVVEVSGSTSCDDNGECGAPTLPSGNGWDWLFQGWGKRSPAAKQELARGYPTQPSSGDVLRRFLDAHPDVELFDPYEEDFQGEICRDYQTLVEHHISQLKRLTADWRDRRCGL